MIRDPRLLALAVEAGFATAEELEYFLHPPEPDPLEWLTSAERIEYVIAHASSGAPAFAGVSLTIEEVETGRTIPPPRRSST